MVTNTATAIAKPHFHGAAHNIIQKGAFTQTHTYKSNEGEKYAGAVNMTCYSLKRNIQIEFEHDTKLIVITFLEIDEIQVFNEVRIDRIPSPGNLRCNATDSVQTW